MLIAKLLRESIKLVPPLQWIRLDKCFLDESEAMKFYNLDEIIGMLDEKDDSTDNEPIEEVDIMQIGDVVVDIVGF